MFFPLEAWCPSLGKKGKGKEVGHQDNRLYSYSTYVLKSIHKRCSPVFWLPLFTELPRKILLGIPEAQEEPMLLYTATLAQKEPRELDLHQEEEVQNAPYHSTLGA